MIGLLGNHELLAGPARAYARHAQGPEPPLSKAEQEQVREWVQNGGRASILQFLRLGEGDMETVCEYLPELSAYGELQVKGRKFVPVYAGAERFSAARSLKDYELEEFLFCRPDPEAAYFPDKTLVFGHTPTRLLYRQLGEPEQPDRIFRRGTLTGIDCGCVYPGGRLGVFAPGRDGGVLCVNRRNTAGERST